MNIIYREFTPADEEQIKDLLIKIAEFLATVNPGRLPSPKPEYRNKYFQQLVNIYNEGRGTIYVAVDNGKIIGYIHGEVKIQSEAELLEFKPVNEGLIRDFFIMDGYRSQGIGKVLLKMMEDYLRNKGCSQYELFVLATNPAVEFYKRQGLQDQLYNMIKTL